MPALEIPGVPIGGQVWRSWLTLGDALSVQRVHLHHAEAAEVTKAGGHAPGVVGVDDAGTLVASPLAGPAPAPDLVSVAGLTAFMAVPARWGVQGVSPSPLAIPATAQAEEVARGHRVLSAPILAAGAAAAWWVGFFASIRHRGVHHVTLTPVTAPVSVEALADASRVVALGAALRLAEAHLGRASEADMTGERVYCAAVAASVEAEREMPALIEGLGELRLVDLVTLAIPWRGRFTKYAGGTGAGQVE